MTIAAEWTKLRSVRSTWWTLLATALLTVGVAAMVAEFTVARPPHNPPDPVALSLTGVQLAQLAVGVLGVLLITGEYATGTIRATLTAVPRRLPILWGKAAVAGLAVFVVGLPLAMASFLVGQKVLGGSGLAATPGALRAIVGSALYLTLIGLLGLALGTLLRSTAGAIAALFGVLFGLPLLAGFLPEHTAEHVMKYLPGPAGTVVTNAYPDPASVGPWSGLALLAGYVALALVLAAWRLRATDV
jgi:ABC-type transport system involved in multi-copper enzyme maturation permease subunit